MPGRPGFRSACCYMGHPRTPENTYHGHTKRFGKVYTSRICQPCRRAREARRRRLNSCGPRQQDKTHCPAGHPYSGHNLIRTSRQRRCRECVRMSNAKYKAALKAAKTQPAKGL